MKSKPVKVGDRWSEAGRAWEVFEVLPFGRCTVRTVDRKLAGDMQTKIVKEKLSKNP